MDQRIQDNLKKQGSFASGNVVFVEEEVVEDKQETPDLAVVKPTPPIAKLMKGNNKYTCRFDIQIDNEKEFQVARRLIGAKGCNMTRIIELCNKGMNNKTTHSDFLSLGQSINSLATQSLQRQMGTN